MSKQNVQKFPVGSANYVIAHADLRRKRRRKHLSVAYRGVRNPRAALQLAMRGTELAKTMFWDGFRIIHYDQRAGIDTDVFHGMFQWLTVGEACQLAVGDYIYANYDHPYGKAYGYTRVCVEGVTLLDNGEYCVFCDSATSRGTYNSHKGRFYQLFSISDEAALALIVDAHPEYVVSELRPDRKTARAASWLFAV